MDGTNQTLPSAHPPYGRQHSTAPSIQLYPLTTPNLTATRHQLYRRTLPPTIRCCVLIRRIPVSINEEGQWFASETLGRGLATVFGSGASRARPRRAGSSRSWLH